MDINTPRALTASDERRIMEMVLELNQTHGGNGAVGLWSKDTEQTFTALVVQSEIRGWMLLPAPTQSVADTLGTLMFDALLKATKEHAAFSEAFVATTIKKLRKH